MKVKTLLVVAAAALLLCAPAFGQNLLTNGGFETGDFTGWTTGGNFGATGVTSGAFYEYTGAQEGNFYAYLGPVGSDATLSQSFTTTAGQQYTFSFWIAAVGDDPSDFSAFWDGTQVYAVTDPNTGGQWTQYSFTETGTGSDSITLSFRDDPAYIALDNVSVTPSASSVPEPSSFMLLGSGALGLAGFLRRKFRG